MKPLVDCVWLGGDGGFAAAAAAAAAPLRDAVEAVVERAERELASLRTDGTLYEPASPAAHDLPRAPFDDAPEPPRGRLSTFAEESMAATGLWGLAVPAA